MTALTAGRHQVVVPAAYARGHSTCGHLGPVAYENMHHHTGHVTRWRPCCASQVVRLMRGSRVPIPET